MKELLETLIKEKGLWKEYLKGVSLVDVDSNGHLTLFFDDGTTMVGSNIWHIDTLREICKAKYQDQWKYHADGKREPVWPYRMDDLCRIESPQEREEYLLNN